MKTKQILTVAIAILFSCALLSFTVLKKVNSTIPVSKVVKKAHSLQLDGYYFYFTSGGNQYELFGTGGVSSGNLTTVTYLCYDNTGYTSGCTVSGTFSLSGGTATLSNVIVKISGGQIYDGGATADYQGEAAGPYSITCGGGK